MKNKTDEIKYNNLLEVLRWLDIGGIINEMDGVLYASNDDSEILDLCESQHIPAGPDQETFIKNVCAHALEIAGLSEEIIYLGLDWDNDKSQSKFSEEIEKELRYMEKYCLC